MNCAEAKQTLHLLIDGELDPAQKEGIECHLQNCPACRNELARLQTMGALLKKDLLITAPAQLDTRVLAAFQKHHQKAVPIEEKRSFFGALFGKILIPIPVFALALAVFAIGIGVAYQVGKASTANVQQIASETKSSEVKPEIPIQSVPQASAPTQLIKYVEVPVLKIVKVPVIQEKTVIKYQERKNESAEKPAPVNLKSPEILTAINNKPAQIQISLRDFQPVSVLKPRIIRNGEDQ